FGVAYALTGLLQSFAFAFVFLFACGIASTIYYVPLISVTQREAPDFIRGRVMASRFLLAQAGLLGGMAISGPLTDRLGAPLVFLTAGTLLGTTHAAAAVTAARPLNVIGAGLLLAVVWFNRRIPGAILFGAGLTLNLIVILAFGGRMPVLLPRDIDPNSAVLAVLKGGLDPLHVALQQPQGLWFLGDVFAIPGIAGHASLVSIGDLLMAAGVAWLIIRCSQRERSLQAAYGPSPSR